MSVTVRPASIGIYATNSIAAGPTITTPYRNTGEHLNILVESEKRNSLGAYVNLPSGLRVVLHNGAWLDPQNRLASAQSSSLRSEFDSLATIMRVNRLRNLTEADRVSNAHLIQEYFHQVLRPFASSIAQLSSIKYIPSIERKFAISQSLSC